MRILAIRGKNIASLAGTFEVDFRREPLASAGLFAICGPTGSGKSTLLDALCLALYDDTPRLANATGRGVNLPDVQDDTISPNDPRTLLRRGSAEGFAEVDFVGNDRVEYRARWAVRRARGRADGRLQPSEMSLSSLADAQPAAGALKGEVLSAIHARLGLGFDQFIRAVLLAQNEFTAFLHADDNARAELLELLTGTDIYSELSRRAFERAKTEQQALDDLKRQIGEQQPLDGDARTALEHAVTHTRSAAEALAHERDELDAQLRWFAELAAALKREGEARAQAEAADRAVSDVEHRRTYLTGVGAVQEARPHLRACERAEADHDESRTVSVPQAAQQAHAALTAQQDANAGLDAAKAALAAAESQQQDGAPHIERARVLDRQAEELGVRLGQASLEAREARTAHGAAQHALTAAQHKRDVHLRERERVTAWLTANAGRKDLADGWPRWDTLLTQAQESERAITAVHGQLTAADADVAGLHEHRRTAVLSREAADARAKVAQYALADAEALLATFDAPQIQADRNALDARRDGLRAAQQLVERIARLEHHRETLEEALGVQSTKAADADRHAAECDARLPGAEAARQQAERAHDETKLASAANVEKLRAGLEPDRPCPVCGGVDHPYAAADHGFGETLKLLKRQLKECTQHVEALASAREAQRAIATQARVRIAELHTDIEATRVDVAAAAQAWGTVPHGSEIAMIARDERSSWLAGELRQVDGDLRRLDETQRASHAAAQARDGGLRTRDTARDEAQDAERLEADITFALQARESAATSLRTDLHRSQDRRDGLLAELDTVLLEPDWRAQWQADPGTFIQTQHGRAIEYRGHVEALHQANEQIGRVDGSLAGLQEATRGAMERADRARVAFETLEADLTTRRRERAAIFEGRAVDEVVREFQEAEVTAQADVERHTQLAGDARAAHIEADTRFGEARRLLEKHERDAGALRAALDMWLTVFSGSHPQDPPLDVPTLRSWLAHDAAWIAAEQDALQALDNQQRHARSILEERRQRREAVEAQRTSDSTADDVGARRRQVGTELDAVQSRRVALESQIRLDDERRTRCEGLAADVERQSRQTTLWAGMNDLIGSADGKRFRNYAQQLTLEILLGFANRHLADLSRRYRLQRLPDKLAIIVIDQDMGDDVRSIHSLSGGESFLVSLALALGLASLSANRVRVESLFIDEGFGSLDADTLSIAIDALDRLHTQGRKVGVISHVPDLAGRIGTRILVERESVGRSRVEVTR